MRRNNTASNNSGEIGVSSKTFQEGEVEIVDLGLKLQNQDRPFLCNQTDHIRGAGEDDEDNNGGSGGPTCNGYSLMSDHIIYNGVGDSSSSSVHSTATAGFVRALQPFNASYSPTNPFFKPSGGNMATAMGYPFTAAQWKELERQAMIYKYMMASLPVPLHLLYTSFPTNPTSYLNLRRWAGNSKDAEPGRCRRTDGKKWRCSRDVAPNQKYCERHMHRGRPRSRKPVELLHPHRPPLSDFPVDPKNNNHPTKKTRSNDSNPQSVGPSSPAFSSIQPSKSSTFDNPMVSSANPFEEPRGLAWNQEQQWQQLVQTSMNSPVFQHQFEGQPLNLNSHSNFNPSSDNIGLLERPLIDAWSMGISGSKDRSSFSSSSHGAHVIAIDDEMCKIHMGLGVIDSWVASSTTPGGPLAEVLRPGSINGSTRSGSNWETPPPATAVSSPSGVLQKNLASLSDSSGSSSPTCHDSKARSDMPFHWLN